MFKARGLVVAAVGVLVAVAAIAAIVLSYIMTLRSHGTLGQLRAQQAFYVAESGLEMATQAISHPDPSQRITCSGVAGNSKLTNSKGGWSAMSGTFSVTGSQQGPPTSLTVKLSASATVIPVKSVAGYPSSGQVRVDRESVDYTGTSTNPAECEGKAPCFTGAVRGANRTMASIHCNGAPVTQPLCTLTSTGGVPSVDADEGKRVVSVGVWSGAFGDGWAVGKKEKRDWNMFRWRGALGSDWAEDVEPDDVKGKGLDLLDVSMVSSADVWAVGKHNAVYRFDGTTWNSVNTGIPKYAKLVSAVSYCEAWVVGDKKSVYRLTGDNSWELSFKAGEEIRGISMIDSTGTGTADAGWIVGKYGNAYYWNGSTWNLKKDGLTKDIAGGVSTLAPNDAWVATKYGQVYQWNGTSWIERSPPGSIKKVSAISFIRYDGMDIGWVVADKSGDKRNNAFYFNGTDWSLRNTNVPEKVKNADVVTVAPNLAFMVSDKSLLQWDGDKWNTIKDVDRYLVAVDAIGPTATTLTNWREIFK